MKGLLVYVKGQPDWLPYMFLDVLDSSLQKLACTYNQAKCFVEQIHKDSF